MGRPERRSVRLPGYDYSDSGVYFVTICTQNRKLYFGDVLSWKMCLNKIGKIIQECWLEIPEHFEYAKLDEFIVMPNHLHGIVLICNSRGLACQTPTVANSIMKFGKPQPKSLASIIGSYKSAVSKLCHKNGFSYFQWQRNYYEHIIKDYEEWERIREYIVKNPEKWEDDRDNPLNLSKPINQKLNWRNFND